MVNHAGGMSCPGCGLWHAVAVGPTHAYIGASPGCWAVFGEVMAREYGPYAYPPVHRLTVDAYAVQHPGEPGRRSAQSVGVHLVALCLALEHGLPPESITAIMGRGISKKARLPWLDPPVQRATMTVADVAATSGLEAHTVCVHAWGRAVWDAWAPHHGITRKRAVAAIAKNEL